MNTALRKKLLWLHTWTGLTAGLVIVLLSVTGAGMVLRPVLDDWVNHDLLVVPECTARLPLDELTQRAVREHPSDKVRAIEVTSSEADASVMVSFVNKDQVYLNPCTGAVLGQQNQYGGFFGVMDWLHRFRFMDNGRAVAGWFSLGFLLVLIVGGTVLWWPRKGQTMGSALTFNPRLPGSARTLNLHRVVGIYSALLLLLMTVTAIPISFVPVRDFIYTLTDYKPPVKPKSKAKPVPGQPGLTMQAAFERLQQLVPEQEWAELRYPPKPGDAIEIELRERNMPHVHAKSLVYLDAHSGETLKISHYATDTGLGRKIYLYFITVHVGLVGGLPYQALLLVAALGVPVQAYSGFSPYLRRKLRRPVKSTMTVTLASKTPLNADIATFEFVHPQGAALPAFSAGSHIDVTLPGGLVRQYSLSNDPSETQRYVIGVLRHADSRGGSIAMHSQLKAGDSVQISAPKNYFPLRPGRGATLLFAGGIGITPILAMARQLAREGRPFELHYVARSRERAAFAATLEAAPFASRVSFHFSDSPAGQPVDYDRLLALHSAASTALYACGPAGFMDKVFDTAKRRGWPAEQLHSEHFSGEVQHLDSDTAFDVKLARSGKVVHIAKHRTVAAVLAECGVNVPVSCEQGVCGTCLTRVLSGQPDHRDAFLTAAERAAQDRFTPCCSRACGPMLVLDL